MTAAVDKSPGIKFQRHPLDTLCINTIRTLSMDAVQAANSGTRARRWRWRRWPTCSGRTSCGSTRRTRSGRTATASCSRPAMRRCCCTRCCT